MRRLSDWCIFASRRHYVACAIGESPVNATMRPSAIYNIFLVLGLIVVILFPEISVWLPHRIDMH